MTEYFANMPWFSWVCLGFVLGVLVGRRAEARLWRGKANHLTRMESGGRLYRVTIDE